MRSSNDGGSKNAINGFLDKRSRAAKPGATSSSISTVSTSESSCFKRRCNFRGRYFFIFTQSTHQMTASFFHSARFTVAKCSATYGEKLQSRSRVGSPWCWAKAIQFQNESCWVASRCAYFRKFLSRDCSRARYSPPSRVNVVSGMKLEFDRPRNAKGERNLFRFACHDPS